MNRRPDDPSREAETFVEILRDRARQRPESCALTYLADDDGAVVERATYAELDRRARALAARLQGLGLAGERALLLYPAGLEFLHAFFGCLYAGVVAVPAPLPPR